jgi:thiamine-phosphate pyrophosphorylase
MPASLLYLITDGLTTAATTSASPEFARLLRLIETAVGEQFDLVQIREKNLTAATLFALARCAATLTRGSSTRLLINDRADVALAAGVAGVHLATTSLAASTVRRAFGSQFLIGVSTHNLTEALAAQTAGANFIVFGPVFATPAKLAYGAPAGLEKLSEIARAVQPLPVLALGGVTLENVPQALNAGAAGIAAIRLFTASEALPATVAQLRQYADGLQHP